MSEKLNKDKTTFHEFIKQRSRRMKKAFPILFTMGLLIFSDGIAAQKQHESQTSRRLAKQAHIDFLFNNVAIHLRDGEILSGLLVGLENTSLIVRMAAKDERIPLNNLSKVVIEKEKKKSRSALYGMVVGLYASNLIFFRAKGHPPAYMQDLESGAGFAFWNIILASAGAGLGLVLGSSFEKKDVEFKFQGDKDEVYAEWEQMEKFILKAESRGKKFHMSLQAGHSFSRVLKNSSTRLENLDFYVSQYRCDDTGCGENASDFNLLRKFQLTFGLSPSIETGIAIMWLGEPSFRVSRYNHGSVEIDQSLNTRGYYAVSIYKPLHHVTGKTIAWKIGLGAGLAEVNYNWNMSSSVWYPEYLSSTAEFKSSKTHLSGVVFTEFSIHPDEFLSFGLIADYVYLPDINIPEIPKTGLPAQNVHLRHGSLGFTLGLNF
jgi:hypothetical protein